MNKTMIGRKFVRQLTYKYRRFHVWFNKKADKYFHNSVIIDMGFPYNYKAAHKIQKKCNDHWSNLMTYIISILITIIFIIIVHSLV